ncbi:MAG: diguanylate cyclase domain-containing protein [Phycisphaerales bacterium]
MKANGTHFDGTDGATGSPQRVILVGRTGLDAKLRLDTEVEVVRTRSALEAVGEVGEPGGASPVVIVSADADPALARGPDGKVIEDPHRAAEFLAALRRVEPTVRILRVEAADGSAPARAGYDGIVDAQTPAEALRETIRGTSPAARVADAARALDAARGMETAHKTEAHRSDAARFIEPTRFFDPALDPEPARAQDSTSDADPSRRPVVEVRADEATALLDAMAPRTEIGDEPVARLLALGRDITDAAIELIRRRLGGRVVELIAGAGPAGASEAAVTWRGRVLGRIRGVGVSTDELLPHAAWLGMWLTLRDQQSQLREAAFTDPLTGAQNRRFFDQFLASVIEQARHARRGVTVLVFDIDNFKQFNDRFGHGAGDEILREAVRLIKSVIRPSDKVCRIGGDEFAVIFHEPSGPRTALSKPPTSAFQIAQRFQRAICEHRFPKLGRDAPGTLTISGGLAAFPWDGDTPQTLLARADDLAIQSKRAGKNCITFGPGAERESGRE